MTDQNLTIALDTHPTGFTVLRVAGELDFHTATRFRQVLGTVASGTGLVIDATGLAYCDSTGVSVLIVTHQRAQADGTPFGIAGLNTELMRLFRMMGVDEVLPFHPTVEEAVSSSPS